MQILKRKWVKGVVIVAAIFLIFHFVLPILILISLDNDVTGGGHYVRSYEESKKRFVTYEANLKRLWNDVNLKSYALAKDESD